MRSYIQALDHSMGYEASRVAQEYAGRLKALHNQLYEELVR